MKVIDDIKAKFHGKAYHEGYDEGYDAGYKEGQAKELARRKDFIKRVL